jgi:hypothetical protein
MTRRIICLLSGLALTVMLTGCGSSSSSAGEGPSIKGGGNPNAQGPAKKAGGGGGAATPAKVD